MTLPGDRYVCHGGGRPSVLLTVWILICWTALSPRCDAASPKKEKIPAMCEVVKLDAPPQVDPKNMEKKDKRYLLLRPADFQVVAWYDSQNAKLALTPFTFTSAEVVLDQYDKFDIVPRSMEFLRNSVAWDLAYGPRGAECVLTPRYRGFGPFVMDKLNDIVNTEEPLRTSMHLKKFAIEDYNTFASSINKESPSAPVNQRVDTASLRHSIYDNSEPNDKAGKSETDNSLMVTFADKYDAMAYGVSLFWADFPRELLTGQIAADLKLLVTSKPSAVYISTLENGAEHSVLHKVQNVGKLAPGERALLYPARHYPDPVDPDADDPDRWLKLLTVGVYENTNDVDAWLEVANEAFNDGFTITSVEPTITVKSKSDAFDIDEKLFPWHLGVGSNEPYISYQDSDGTVLYLPNFLNACRLTAHIDLINLDYVYTPDIYKHSKNPKSLNASDKNGEKQQEEKLKENLRLLGHDEEEVIVGDKSDHLFKKLKEKLKEQVKGNPYGHKKSPPAPTTPPLYKVTTIYNPADNTRKIQYSPFDQVDHNVAQSQYLTPLNRMSEVAEKIAKLDSTPLERIALKRDFSDLLNPPEIPQSDEFKEVLKKLQNHALTAGDEIVSDDSKNHKRLAKSKRKKRFNRRKKQNRKHKKRTRH